MTRRSTAVDPAELECERFVKRFRRSVEYTSVKGEGANRQEEERKGVVKEERREGK